MFGYRNGKGAVVVDGAHVADTVMCVHCGIHWEVIPGSGKRRGFCMFCKGVSCGAEYCMKDCHPFEARVELSEAIAQKNMKVEMSIRNKYQGIKPV